MKFLTIAAVMVAAFFVEAAGAQAQNETDRAMGAGSYLNPTGPAQGVWTNGASPVNHVGAASGVHKKHKA